VILIDASVKRPVFATMLIAALMVFGLFALPRMGVDIYPQVDFPVVTARVIYPGADPQTMEEKIAEPIEDAISSMSGIRRITSRNLEGVTLVIVEMELDVESDVAMQDVRDKIAGIERELPRGIDPPVIARFNSGAAPLMSLALSSDLPPQELTRIADKLVRPRLQQVSGVGGVNLIGDRSRQVQVLADAAKLSAYGLAIEDLGRAIQAQHLNVPGGIVERNGQEITVTTRGEAKSVDEIGGLIITGLGGSPLRLRDVATVVDGLADTRSIGMVDGKSALVLEVVKQPGANAVALADAVSEEIEKLRPRLTEAGVALTIPIDNSVFIRRSINDVKWDMIYGAILTVCIIFVFLHSFRATLVSAIAIPTSVIGSFAFMFWLGFTFNYMTMLALSLSIGILVDDAIVVVENIYRHLQMGKSPIRAALDATNEISFAVIATTLSLFAVFVPVAFMSGLVGRFFFQFGMTVTISVLISTLVSFTLTPMLSARLLSAHEKKGAFAQLWDRGLGALEHVYTAFIRVVLRRPVLAVLSGVAIFAASVGIAAFVPMEFIPREDRSEFAVVVETPTGTSLAETTKHVEAIAEDLQQNLPGIRTTLATVAGGSTGQSNLGKIRVSLLPALTRPFSQHEAMAWVRQRTAANQGALVSVEELDPMGSDFRTQQIQYALQGSDLAELERASSAIAQKLRETKGFVDVDTTLRSGKPEMQVRIDRQRAADLGVPVASIALTIRALMAQDAVSTFEKNGELYDIVVRLPKEERDRLDSFENIKVRSTSGNLVDLAALARIDLGEGPSSIERFNRQRMAVVLAQLEDMPLSEATATVEAAAAPFVGNDIRGAWLGDSEMMQDTASAMLNVMLLAVILVYMILAAQFDSFTQPLVIMVSLPLSGLGAFGGLLISGMSFNIFSFIGLIMLMGLVTKAAILLIDLTNQLRDEGHDVIEALVTAGRTRLRPILMTAGSTIIGMVPIALALSEGGETRAPMAVCVIGGMITSTMLTLVFVPSVYLLNDAILRKIGFSIRRHDPSTSAT
jgi:HAE1 family hydrophobic/amphiphilic exporter-1